MGEEKFALDRDGFKRMAQAVRGFETVNTGPSKPGNGTPMIQCVFARLTSQDDWRYAWSQIRVTESGYEVITGGLTGTTTERYAVDPTFSAESALVDTNVILARVTRQIDDVIEPIWVVAGSAGSGGTIPPAEYQGMVYSTLASNSRGDDFPRIHAVF